MAMPLRNAQLISTDLYGGTTKWLLRSGWHVGTWMHHNRTATATALSVALKT